jgi:hypothetical protein
MSELEPLPRIVITVEGGVVQSIYATRPVESLVVDYDDLTDAQGSLDDLTRSWGGAIPAHDWRIYTDEEQGVPRGTNARIAAFLQGTDNWTEV